MNRLRTFILVTFVTVLIWAFAEGQSLQTKRAAAEINLPVTPVGNFVISVAPDQNWRGVVEVLVEGSATSLDGLDTVLREPITLAPGLDGVPRESGEYTLEFRELLRGIQPFRTRGITVLAAQPPSIRVIIEELTTIQMDIEVASPAGELEGQAIPVGRTQAAVRLPARVAAALATLPQKPVVLARVRPEDLARLEPGRRTILPNVRIEPGPSLAGVQPLEISPPQVDVQLAVRSKTEMVIIPSVSVDVRMPPDLLNQWEIDIPQEERDLRDVRVTGPSEIIQRIRDNQQPVTAFIRLSYTELEKGATSATADFTNLPSQLTVEADDREVHFTARRREPAPEGGLPPGS